MTRNKKHNRYYESSAMMLKAPKIREDPYFDDDLSRFVDKERRLRKVNKKQLKLYQTRYSKEYQFYALAVKSGILHLAYAYEHSFDDEGNLKDFDTFCGRTIRREFSPDFDTNWHISDDTPDCKKYCIGCQAAISRGSQFKVGKPIEG